jgi:hypothetical protein
MRVLMALATCALAACTSGVPNEVVVYEVPPPGYDLPPATGGTSVAPATGTASTNGGQFAGTTAAPMAAGGAVTQIGDDRLNLAEFSLEQQRIDAAAAERDLQQARSQLVVVQPGGVPSATAGPNIALYAQQSANALGERIYPRSRGVQISSNCRRYSSNDEAQRAFLAAGGPQADSLSLDPDGDGFACDWDPSPYRALR